MPKISRARKHVYHDIVRSPPLRQRSQSVVGLANYYVRPLDSISTSRRKSVCTVTHLKKTPEDGARGKGEEKVISPPPSLIPPESRGQRKRQAKKDAWQRKFDFTNYVKQVVEKRKNEYLNGKALTNLDDMKLKLDQILQEQKPGERHKTTTGERHKREKVRQLELARYEAVTNFEVFQADPLKAVELHLRNTTAARTMVEEIRPN